LKYQAGRPIKELIEEFVVTLEGVCAASTLPVIYDQGGISSEERTLVPEFDLLYNAIAVEPRVDSVIVTNKRIRRSDQTPLPSVRVTELSHGATASLVRLIARDRGQRPTPAEVEAISLYSRGYPPAVTFAMNEAQIYGIPHVITNQRALINFSAEIFVKQLAADRKLTDKMGAILQLLANYSPLPLSVIQQYIKFKNNEAIAKAMSYLLDYALVVPTVGLYRISEPIRDAAYRTFGGFYLDHGRVADLLEEYLRDTDEDETRIQLAQNLFRATLLGNRVPTASAIGLASDLIALTEQAYHDQDYENAVRFGKEAIEIRPNSLTVRRFLAQTYVRKEMYPEAEEQINAMLDQGHIGEAFYVKGFMARRRRQYKPAIEYYSKSVEFGRGGTSYSSGVSQLLF
jgi:tetratricopeptide (TPR) repeat protein